MCVEQVGGQEGLLEEPAPPDGGGGADHNEMDSGRKTGMRAEPR